VIGGSGTVGGAVVRTLVHGGARVASTSRSGEAADGLPTFALDLLDVDAIAPVVRAACEALGGLDALVCCAGVVGPPPYPATIDQIDAGQWDELMAVNARGPFFCARAAAPLLAPGGCIVLTGSVDAVKPLPAAAHHAASNAALGGLVRALARELGPRGISVNLVAPGLLEQGQSSVVPPALVADYLRHAALGRSGRIAEVATTIAWLATTNTAVTGQTLVIDGGL
jgi:3-oxoacyl-[acyl-carrier protein] reductase